MGLVPHSLLLAWLAVLTLLLEPICARLCTELKHNILTSVGCDPICRAWPCVLYSPTQDQQCGSAPCCWINESYTPPSSNLPCMLTHQCLDNLTGDKGVVWDLVIDQPRNDEMRALVTQISQLKYPDGANVRMV